MGIGVVSSRASETAGFCRATPFSEALPARASERETDVTPIESAILAELKQRHRGRHAAITARDLGAIVGADERLVREAIHELRVRHDQGEILSGTGRHALGFWWSLDAGEIEAFRAELISRYKDMMEVASAAWHARERVLSPPPAQKSLL